MTIQCSGSFSFLCCDFFSLFKYKKKKKNLKKALYNAWNKVEKEAFFGQSNQIKNHQHRFCHLSWSHDY